MTTTDAAPTATFAELQSRYDQQRMENLRKLRKLEDKLEPLRKEAEQLRGTMRAAETWHREQLAAENKRLEAERKAAAEVAEAERVRVELERQKAEPEIVVVDGIEYDMDELVRAQYEARGRSPRAMSDEAWARTKLRFRTSVSICRQDVLQQIEDGEF